MAATNENRERWIQRPDADTRLANAVHDGLGAIRISRFFNDRMRLAVRVQLWELAPGTSEGAHVHAGDDPADDYEELYYVLSGHGRMTIDDQVHDLHPDDAVLVPVDVDHGLEAMGDEPLRILLLFGKPAR